MNKRIKRLLLEWYPDDPAIKHLTQKEINRAIQRYHKNILFNLERGKIVNFSKSFGLRKRILDQKEF